MFFDAFLSALPNVGLNLSPSLNSYAMFFLGVLSTMSVGGGYYALQSQYQLISQDELKKLKRKSKRRRKSKKN